MVAAIRRQRQKARPFLVETGGLQNYAYRGLLNFARTLFTVSFPCQCFFGTAFFSRLQVKRMPFDFFNDIFLLHFALESAQGAL